MKKALLTAKEIVKAYPSAQEPVLNHINTEIYSGDFTVIMGPSGAGKSTLLYALSGMDTISSGQVLYKGKELGTLSEKKMAALRAKEFGFVFQQTHLVSNLTLFENVVVAGFLEKGKSEQAVRDRAKELLKLMKVEKAKDRLPSEVSGGEAQRVKLAAELARIPRGHTIYILDEPTTGLHMADIEQLLKVLFKLRDLGNTVLVIEHNLDVIKSADHIIDLGPDGGAGGGTLVAAGTPEEIAKNPKSYTGQYLKPYLK